MKQKVDEEEIQRRIDRHFRWQSPEYRLAWMEGQAARVLADPNGRFRCNIRKGTLVERVNEIILPSSRSGLLVGPDGKPI